MKHITILIAVVFSMATIGAGQDDPVLKNLDAEAAKKLLAESPVKIVVLDVRTPDEFAEGHLKNAILVDYLGDDFEGKLSALDKSASYLLHCRSGRRSSDVLDMMKKLGFKTVYHLDGGILAWQKVGGAVEK